MLKKLEEILMQCPECKGKGYMDFGATYYLCEFCDGEGYMNIFKKIYFKIILYFYKRKRIIKGDRLKQAVIIYIREIEALRQAKN